MTNEARLWLIRHAPVARPRGIIHDSDAPADLSDHAAFAALQEKLPKDAHVLASPSRRTMETAQSLGLAPVPDARLREQNFGAWTGRRHAEIEAELGAGYHAFWQKPATNRPPGGESFADQIGRVRACLAALPAGDAILVVHSGTVRAALAIALDGAPESALRFVIDPLSLTRIDRLAEGWRIVHVNRAAHA
jgi:alpha-ribazole phosphatase